LKFSKAFAVAAFVFGAAALVSLAAQAPTPQAGTPGTPNAQTPAAPGAGRGGRGGRGAAPAAGGFPSAYPQHAQADQATIDRGKALYDANCASCHAADARGTPTGINLLRSELVMDDQSGELIAPVVQYGWPDTGMPKFDLSTSQISDIAAYIHSFHVAGYDPSRNVPPNILVGDASAGEAFFNGAGKCNTCHSVTGDLAGIGTKMQPKTLQNAIVSGRGGGGGFGFGAPAAPPDPRTTETVSVTLPSGKTVSGKLDTIDDFLVSLTDDDGNHLTYARNGDVPKVVVHNPLQAHIDMLPKLTDDEIHNLTAYLVTIK
jgi:cytochrome c oxidase cbb3-type subunit III